MELIKITEQNGNRAVDARELHDFLGSKQQFGNWINNRINEYGFIENQDYVSFNKKIKRGIGGTVAKEYAISVDMAKELSMVEKSEKGKMARLYFIEMEKKAKQQPVPRLSNADEDQMYLELTSLIRKYLQRGDVKDVARTTGLGEKTLGLVAKGMKAKPKFIQALYQRAVENKKSGKVIDIQKMINNLR